MQCGKRHVASLRLLLEFLLAHVASLRLLLEFLLAREGSHFLLSQKNVKTPCYMFVIMNYALRITNSLGNLFHLLKWEACTLGNLLKRKHIHPQEVFSVFHGLLGGTVGESV